MKSNEDTHVSFRVVGFEGSPDEITARLGIDPDQRWIKGESISDKGGTLAQSRWAITRPISMDDSLENQLGALLDMLEARADEVRSMVATYEAGICVYGYIREATHPETRLEPQTLARLVALNLSLDFDFYGI